MTQRRWTWQPPVCWHRWSAHERSTSSALNRQRRRATLDVLFGDRTLLVDLPALTEADIDSFLHSYLGGPMMAPCGARAPQMGNPLFLRELVQAR